jgi:ABC-type Mn2+/Zn2+ transport system ATPase subunit
MAKPIVELRNVSFAYGKQPVLEDISIHLHAGQFAGIVGPNGAGKTTLLKLVIGLLVPTHGSVLVKGVALKGQPSPHIAYVPQIETIDWNFPLTVEQLVMMGRIHRMGAVPWPKQSDKVAALEMLERLGLAPLAKRHIRDLSGGQQQRAFLARALLAQPDLLVLDEPTSGVDLRTQDSILHLLAELNQTGITILLTTHDLNSAAAHLPWVLCINRRLVAAGPPDTVFTERTLNETYQGNIVTVRSDGILFIAERPHNHNYREIIPDPVAGGDIHTEAS